MQLQSGEENASPSSLDAVIANDGILRRPAGPPVFEVDSLLGRDLWVDIGLPGMDGYEAASWLQREECCKDVVNVAISGYGQDEARRRSKEAGFDYHLLKPLVQDALLSRLATPRGNHESRGKGIRGPGRGASRYTDSRKPTTVRRKQTRSIETDRISP